MKKNGPVMRRFGETSIDFMSGGGEMGSLMRSHDWSNTCLGDPLAWPQPLRIAVRLMLNSGHPMYIWWGSSAACLYNDAYRASIGPERHPQSLGRPARDVWEEIWPIIGPQIEQVMAGKGATWHKDQLVPITRNGRREDVYWTYSFNPIDDIASQSGVGGVLVICTETTDRVQTEKALALQIQRQQRLFQCAPGFIAILRGPDHVFEFVNEAYIRLVGKRDCVGKSLLEVFPEVRNQEFPKLLDDVYASGKRFVAYQRPIHLRRGDGGETEERFLDFIYEPITDADGVIGGIFVEGFDVTDQREAQEALRQLNATLESRVEERTRDLAAAQDELRQAQKMEAIGQLTGGIAHDFNNLLAGISGSLELLTLRLSQGRYDEADRYISAARGASKRAAALTHRLLAFARRQTLDPRPTDVVRLVKDMEELIRRTVGPTISVRIGGTKSAWNILVDGNQLENVLLNLCINARDAMPEGGALTIEASNQTLDVRDARKFDLIPGSYVLLSVSDTGTGMTPEIMARAFDPFYTTKPIGAGTGLGLSMTYGFARQSGGHVHLTSKLLEGTQVCLYLPRHEGDADSVEVLETSMDVLRTQRDEGVLIIDDEPIMRMLISDILQELGYVAFEAADGPAGLKILQSGERIDLLITDMGLPGGINGRQIADAARRSRPGLKVLFITGYAAETAALAPPDVGSEMNVLAKPFPLEALTTQINQLLGHS